MVNVLTLCVCVCVQGTHMCIYMCVHACTQEAIGKLHYCSLRAVCLACSDRASVADQQAPKICLLLPPQLWNYLVYTLSQAFYMSLGG